MRFFRQLRRAATLDLSGLCKLFPRDNQTVLAVRRPGKDFNAHPVIQLKSGAHPILTVPGAERQLASARGHYSPYSMQLSSRMAELALSYLAEDEVDKAIEMYEEIYQLRQQVRGITWEFSEVALALARLFNNETEASHELLEKAYLALPSNDTPLLLPKDRLAKVIIPYSLGLTHAALENLDNSAEMLEQARQEAGKHSSLAPLAPYCEEAIDSVQTHTNSRLLPFSASK